MRHTTVRIGVSAALGVCCGIGTWYALGYQAHLNPGYASDFAQLWYAARALLNGTNPYESVGPGRAFEWPFPLLYPLPAVLAIAPIAWLPLHVAEVVFVGFGTAALAYALTGDTTTRAATLWVFASVAMLRVCNSAQWSPLITAAALMPNLGFLLACKPTIGLAMLCAYPSRRAVIGAAGFLLLATAIWPGWISEWLATLPTGTHLVAPVSRPGGPLLLLAALRWRRPEARLLLAMACVPHTPSIYEVVPLFLVASRFEEGLVLATLALACQALTRAMPHASYLDRMTTSAGLQVALIYLPCLLMVWRRPNTGASLRWVTLAPQHIPVHPVAVYRDWSARLQLLTHVITVYPQNPLIPARAQAEQRSRLVPRAEGRLRGARPAADARAARSAGRRLPPYRAGNGVGTARVAVPHLPRHALQQR